ARAGALETRHGVAVPAWALDGLVLPARVADCSPALLDELCASGEVVWSGHGSIGAGDGWVRLAYADVAPLLLPEPDPDAIATPLHAAVLGALDGGQALFFRALADRAAAEFGPDGPVTTDEDVAAAVWDLVWAGYLSNDTLAPLRALQAGGAGAHRAKAAPTRARMRRPGLSGYRFDPGRVGTGGAVARPVPPNMAGRWYRLPERDTDPTRRAAALADAPLDRHGVGTRGPRAPRE